MNDTYVTLQGWVGNDVEVRDVNGSTCASFRVGCTPRFQKDGDWVSGQTSWYTVNCWRTLGRNVAESVHKGDPVVVHGRVRVDVWEREGQPRSTAWFVEAGFVGHDLNRGVSRFTRSGRTAQVETVSDGPVKEMLHGYQAGGPELDADGQPVEPAA